MAIGETNSKSSIGYPERLCAPPVVILKTETHFSCDSVDCGLWLAILSSLLCPETDRNIRIGKQGYVFYFTDFKK